MSIAATVSQAVLSRHSCRSFSDRPVERETVRRLIEAARYAPSGGNLQPWIVHVLSGDSLARFRRLMAPKIEAAPLGGDSEYHVYPANLKEPYRTRRFKVGEDLYGHIGIARENKVARVRQFARNFDFFGAPVAMFFLLDRSMGPPQWSDLGMFIQTLSAGGVGRMVQGSDRVSGCRPRVDALLRACPGLRRLRRSGQPAAVRANGARGVRPLPRLNGQAARRRSPIKLQ
jgi:nitroreductase